MTEQQRRNLDAADDLKVALGSGGDGLLAVLNNLKLLAAALAPAGSAE
jgi:hypothetical protein